MTPLEIKIELLKARVTNAQIARRAKVKHHSIVTRVISYERVSLKVRKEIAKALGYKKKDWQQIFTPADAEKARAERQRRKAAAAERKAA